MKGSKQSEGECGLANRGRWRRVMKRRFRNSIPEISVRNQMEQTILVWSDRNIWDYLWRWSSTLTGLVISVGRTKMSFSIWQIDVLSTAPLYPACKWIGSGLCIQNVSFYWAREISEISNGNFCWMESAQGEWKLMEVNGVEGEEWREIIKSRIKVT